MTDSDQSQSEVRRGLSAKLLTLTSMFVMLAVVLVYVPSVATFYERWLADRIGRAHSIALVLDAAPSGMVPETLARQLLDSIGARLIVLQTGDSRRLLASSDSPPAVSREVDLRTPQGIGSVRDAFSILLHGDGIIRAIGDAPGEGQFIEVLLDEAPLKEAMLSFSRNVLLVTLIVAGITGWLVYLSLDRIIVRPVRRLAERMAAFGENPDRIDAEGESGRTDEIGLAERQLALMQGQLRGHLQNRARLASLGLAVSKIGHDLRNLLTAAQLGSERLAMSDDPAVKRLSGKLVSTLERAVAYCQSTLAYGSAQEPTPERRPVDVQELSSDLREAIGIEDDANIGWVESIEKNLTVDADPDQLFRVLLNLGRNARQALESKGKTDPSRDQIRIVGRREGATVVIEMSDTGPGVFEHTKETLFDPFQGSTKPGGTGLGLAIAAELVRAHGGDIRLIDGTIGATFRITIPDRAIDLRERAAARARA